MDWSNLRTIDGSQHMAFEKICCQLASSNAPKNGKQFVVKGDGADAGVECFWILENEDEHAWQAKFFLSAPNSNQWSQIDNSVETALTKHSKLTKYTVCLPIDRSDARRDNQISFLDRWNKKVERWEKIALKLGMQVEFQYCGEHEIFTWLSEGPRGRYKYWFNSTYFDDIWFVNNIKLAVDLAGPRYTPNFVSNPDLHVELDIATLFDGLGKTPELFTKLRDLHKRLENELYFLNHLPQKSSKQAKELSASWRAMNIVLLRVYELAIHKDLPFDEMKNHIAELIEKATLVKNTLSTSDENESYLNREIQPFISVLHQLNATLESNEFQSSNTGNLVLIGDAGSGKTHLFCDVATHRIERGLPTILILGEQFQKDISWQALIQELNIDLSTDEFLEALNTLGQVRDCRIIIMIDALNESDDYLKWETRLVQFVLKVDEYDYLALAVSIREPYEKVILREDLITTNRITKARHLGFADHEYEASKKFFQHYKITEPSIPLLNPEFSNPLFLKLFCEAFEQQELDNVKGYRGITAIFDHFLRKINRRLSHPNFLDFDASEDIVQSAISALVDEMIVQQKTTIPFKDAQSIVSQVYNISPRHSKSLYRYLLAEGVISEAPIWHHQNDTVEKGIRFAYERFSDHLITAQLLDQHLEVEDPVTSFHEGTKLREILLGDTWRWLATQLISAFAIQIPERTNKELFELIPEIKEHWKAPDAFLESLKWRRWNVDDVSELIIEMLNGNHFRVNHRDAFDVLFSVATDPESPINAHFLDRNLSRQTMPDRDAYWGVLMHETYDGGYSAIERVIQWGWSIDSNANLDTESLHLAGITLSWLLISQNRFIRDRSTKALINLYTPRLQQLPDLIKQFHDVDDMYIHERLYAVAYGCAMRSEDSIAIQALAQHIYYWIFANSEPPPHILLRDYAKGVIDVALHKNINLNVDASIFNPPYNSQWITEPPSMDKLERKYGKHSEKMDDIEWSRISIVHSVTSIDFGVYIIDPRVAHWTSERLNDDRFTSPNEVLSKFVAELSEEQEEAWHKFRQGTFTFIHQNLEEGVSLDVVENNDEETSQLETFQMQYRTEFLTSLNDAQRASFENEIEPYLFRQTEEMNKYRNRLESPTKLAQRWILNQVFELGWTVERFGKFDRYINRWRYSGRESKKPERFGKKYQWLALHEFLARLADNYHLKGESWKDEEDPRYKGMWQVRGRDIDPSHTLSNIAKKNWSDDNPSWWFTVKYNDWHKFDTLEEWVINQSSLPSVKELIEVVEPVTKSKFIILQGHYEWQQPKSIVDDIQLKDSGVVRLHLRSYLIHKEHAQEMYDWGIEQDYWNYWMPDTHSLYMPECFLGEFYWSRAFHYHREQTNQWIAEGKWPRPIMLTTDSYTQENGYDGSIEDTLRVDMPSKWLVDNMELRLESLKGAEGFYKDKKLIAFDPAINSDGPHGVLVDKAYLVDFLRINNYAIFWTIVGEKMIINAPLTARERFGYSKINGAGCFDGEKLLTHVQSEFQDHRD